jgi:hypothetical protein
MSAQACPVPDSALMQRYVGQGATYTDCYRVEVPQQVSLSEFVTAFYTTPLFRAERLILSLALRKRIHDGDINAMLSGRARTFAIWHVEEQSEDELLVCDAKDATRSWFWVMPLAQGGAALHFGSVVLAQEGRPLPKIVQYTTPLHLFYARSLLNAARRRLLM